MFYTYIIFSENVNRYYVGSTQNVEHRIHQHNSDFSKSTKGKGPWALAKSFAFDTRAEAMALEKKIKKRGAFRFLKDLNTQK